MNKRNEEETDWSKKMKELLKLPDVYKRREQTEKNKKIQGK